MQPYLVIFQHLAHERQRLSLIYAAAGVRLLHGIVVLQCRFRIAQCENCPADTFPFFAQGYDCGRELVVCGSQSGRAGVAYQSEEALTKYADIKVKEIAKYEGVYFDMLQQIFTDVTGLYTRL